MPSCPLCSSEAELVGGDAIYPHRPDLAHKKFWKCPHHDTYVGCHPGTDKPLGRLADAPTRKLKSQAHAAFDPIWKNGGMKRGAAYGWLAQKLGIPKCVCHMGSMSDDNLRRVISICKENVK